MCLDSKRIVTKPRNYMMELKYVEIVLVIIHLNLRQLVRKSAMMLQLDTDQSA
jgi:hypothetical protein